MKDIMDLTIEELTALTKSQTKPSEPPKEGYKWVKNIMDGVWIQIPKDTPYCCDPSTETYWSM